MFSGTLSRRLVSGLAGSFALLALAAPGFAQMASMPPGPIGDMQPGGVGLIRPVEADIVDPLDSGYVFVTDAGQPGVAGTGGVYVVDPLDVGYIWSFAPTSGAWALKDPSAAERLNNGEILIADTGNHRVLIVNAAGQIVWNSATVQFSDGRLLRGPSDVQVLPDMTPSMADNPILIACKANNRVVAAKRSGQVMWAMNAGLSAPLKAERLPNGNTLIVESQRVIEVNAAKQTVLSLISILLPSITDAERLADGSTLVLDGVNGELLRHMPGQSENLDDLTILLSNLTGATDVDALELENGGLDLVVTTPNGIADLALFLSN